MQIDFQREIQWLQVQTRGHEPPQLEMARVEN